MLKLDLFMDAVVRDVIHVGHERDQQIHLVEAGLAVRDSVVWDLAAAGGDAWDRLLAFPPSQSAQSRVCADQVQQMGRSRERKSRNDQRAFDLDVVDLWMREVERFETTSLDQVANEAVERAELAHSRVVRIGENMPDVVAEASVPVLVFKEGNIALLASGRDDPLDRKVEGDVLDHADRGGRRFRMLRIEEVLDPDCLALSVRHGC